MKKLGYRHYDLMSHTSVIVETDQTSEWCFYLLSYPLLPTPLSQASLLPLQSKATLTARCLRILSAILALGRLKVRRIVFQNQWWQNVSRPHLHGKSWAWMYAPVISATAGSGKYKDCGPGLAWAKVSPYLQNNQSKTARCVAQAVESLLSKHEVLSSNPSTRNKTKPKQNEKPLWSHT
jgi:hypothetical protein